MFKGDIKKFFANIDHEILLGVLKERIADSCILDLLENIINSFSAPSPACIPRNTGVGLPLGNLTSQLLVNVYMNEFDQFVKHELKAKHYIRYADDFVFLSEDKKWLENLIPKIQQFLKEHLRLELHPDKLFIKTIASGVDFLGWIHFPDYRVLRTATKRRMMKRLEIQPNEATLQSYLGLLRHGNTHTIQRSILKRFAHSPYRY